VRGQGKLHTFVAALPQCSRYTKLLSFNFWHIIVSIYFNISNNTTTIQLSKKNYVLGMLIKSKKLPVMVMSSRSCILLVMCLPWICGVTSSTMMMVHCVGMINLTSGVMWVIITIPKWRWEVSGRHWGSI